MLQSVSVSGLGPSAIISIPESVGFYGGAVLASLLVNFSGASAVGTVDVQVSNDPGSLVSVPNPALLRWNKHDTMQGLTGDKNGNLATIVGAVRLNCTAWTQGTITLQVAYQDRATA